MRLKNQDITNLTNREASNSIQNEPNYKSVKIGMSSGNMANSATLRRCNLTGNSLFQVSFLRLSLCSPGLY